MKKSFPIAALLLATGWVFTGQAQGSIQESGLESRVSALEAALADEEKAHAETRAILDQTVAYIQNQAKTAQKMMTVLDSAEAAGFTAGINFKSREMLLAGFRQTYGNAQKDVPGGKKQGASR